MFNEWNRQEHSAKLPKNALAFRRSSSESRPPARPPLLFQHWEPVWSACWEPLNTPQNSSPQKKKRGYAFKLDRRSTECWVCSCCRWGRLPLRSGNSRAPRPQSPAGGEKRFFLVGQLKHVKEGVVPRQGRRDRWGKGMDLLKESLPPSFHITRWTLGV